MFVALKQLLSQSPSLTMSITGQGNDLTVVVMPKPTAGDCAALAQPLKLTGTAEELDAGFVEALAQFSTKRLSVVEQVEATTAVLEAGRKESAAKAASAIKKGAKSSTASAPASTSDDDDGQDDTQSTATSDGAAPAATADVGQSAINIFA
jgi:PRTRC genetic system protein E